MANQTTVADKRRLSDTNRSESYDDSEPERQYIHVTATVERPMNSHGGMWLSAAGGTRTFQVVDYATDEVRLTLAREAGGTTVEVRLAAIGSRGAAWRAVAVEAGHQSDDHRVATSG